MSMRDTWWLRLRDRLRPLTRRIPYGHVITESATYSRLLVPRFLQPRHRFVIFAQGRSGSTLLADLLNSHPRIYCADEILTDHRRRPAAYARACSVGHRGDVYGFKVKIYHLTDGQGIEQPGEFLRQLHVEGWQIIHLQRRNVLRQALSAAIAAERRTYHEPADRASNGRGPVPLDVDDLLWRTAQREQFCRAEAEALDGIPHLALSYEDDLLTPHAHQRTASRVFDFLGVEDMPVSTSLRKIGDRGLEELVTNHDEVRRAVSASPYHQLLGED